ERRNGRLVPRWSVAGRAARVREDLARLGEEPPLVPGRAQHEAQHPVRTVLYHLAVRLDGAEGFQAGSAGADHELPDPGRRVRDAVRRHRREAFVGVLVAVDDDLGACLIEVLPQGEPISVTVAVENTGSERRLVPDRRGALLGAGGEVRLEPLLLGRPRARVHVVVDRDHVPDAEGVAVVSLRRVPRSGTEIVVVSRSARGGIVVIARYRPGARLVPPPGWTVAIGKLGCRPVGIGVVARRVHRT